MTEPTLKEIQDRLEKATAGEWTHHPAGSDMSNKFDMCEIRAGSNLIADCFWYWPKDLDTLHEQRASRGEADADFIAHAPTDVAWLLGEVKRLQAIIDQLQDLVT